MLDKMRQLMEVKRQAEELKRELDRLQIEINEERGIRIVISGSQNFQKIEVDTDLFSDKSRLEAGLLKSLNAAIAKSQGLAAQKMKAMTGLNIPGL